MTDRLLSIAAHAVIAAYAAGVVGVIAALVCGFGCGILVAAVVFVVVWWLLNVNLSGGER